jgi:hypothetical protein
MRVGHPLVILAPGRSYTSVVCTMLGQHPQMYNLPELHLFACEGRGVVVPVANVEPSGEQVSRCVGGGVEVGEQGRIIS